MAQWTTQDLAEKMKGIDFAMFSTTTDGGLIASRPMSNNGDVEYDGDSWFFCSEGTRTVRDIKATPEVSLSFQGKSSLLGRPGIFLAVQGVAEIVRDKTQFEKHWTKDLNFYYPKGIDSPGLLLIKVRANRIHYWDGENEGEIRP